MILLLLFQLKCIQHTISVFLFFSILWLVFSHCTGNNSCYGSLSNMKIYCWSMPISMVACEHHALWKWNILSLVRPSIGLSLFRTAICYNWIQIIQIDCSNKITNWPTEARDDERLKCQFKLLLIFFNHFDMKMRDFLVFLNHRCLILLVLIWAISNRFSKTIK